MTPEEANSKIGKHCWVFGASLKEGIVETVQIIEPGIVYFHVSIEGFCPPKTHVFTNYSLAFDAQDAVDRCGHEARYWTDKMMELEEQIDARPTFP